MTRSCRGRKRILLTLLIFKIVLSILSCNTQSVKMLSQKIEYKKAALQEPLSLSKFSIALSCLVMKSNMNKT